MKSKTYFQLESLVENLKVFRHEMVSSRIPKYEQNYRRRKRQEQTQIRQKVVEIIERQRATPKDQSMNPD